LGWSLGHAGGCQERPCPGQTDAYPRCRSVVGRRQSAVVRTFPDNNTNFVAEEGAVGKQLELQLLSDAVIAHITPPRSTRACIGFESGTWAIRDYSLC
jgi:hypothetical protein